jgi:hypothetical protein
MGLFCLAKKEKIMTKTINKIDSHRPFIAFDSSKELKCVAHTLVARCKVIDEKYPGGLNELARKHSATFNQDILVACGTSEEIVAAAKDLRAKGMNSNYDFISFDAEDYKRIGSNRLAKSKKPYTALDFNIVWLKGYYYRSDKAIKVCIGLKNSELVYSPVDGNIVFMHKCKAEQDAKWLADLSQARGYKLTWEEFQDQFPDTHNVMFNLMAASNLPSLEAWYEEHKNEHNWKSISDAKQTFVKEIPPWDRMPLPEEALNCEFLYDWFFWIGDPVGILADWVPAEISKYGTIEQGMTCGTRLNLKAEYKKEIISEFNRLGYACQRDDDLIWKNMWVK